MRLANILQLGVKELRGLARDPMLVVLILYAFTLSIYTASTSMCQRRRKTRPLGGAKPGQYSRHAGKRREGVARAVLACVRGDFRRTVQADWPDFRALL